MKPELIYRPMQPGEAFTVCAMVERCFNTFVAPDYLVEGRHSFMSYAAAEPMAQRQQAGNLVLVADCGGVIAGMIEMRGNDHISLLFVDETFHRHGISRQLVQRALTICRQRSPNVHEVTVNSSPYAVPIYERLGFQTSGPEQEKNGIRFIPMTFKLDGL